MPTRVMIVKESICYSTELNRNIRCGYLQEVRWWDVCNFLINTLF